MLQDRIGSCSIFFILFPRKVYLRSGKKEKTHNDDKKIKRKIDFFKKSGILYAMQKVSLP